MDTASGTWARCIDKKRYSPDGVIKCDRTVHVGGMAWVRQQWTGVELHRHLQLKSPFNAVNCIIVLKIMCDNEISEKGTRWATWTVGADGYDRWRLTMGVTRAVLWQATKSGECKMLAS